MCIASTAVYLTYIEAAEAASMLDVLLSSVLLCVFNVQSVSNLSPRLIYKLLDLQNTQT